jgi:alkaline phosphatase D
MWEGILLILGIILIFFSCFTISLQPLSALEKSKFKVSFGSCNNFDFDPTSTIFSTIAEYDPDVFIWLGDVVYLDEKFLFHRRLPPFDKIIKKFNDTKLNKHYQKLYNNPRTSIVGVWDDHDYGQNDGDKTFSLKEQMRHIFLDFLDVPQSNDRRNKSGIYTSYYVEHKDSDIKIKLILLDVRFNKDKELGDMLGEEQWEWLNAELLENNEAALTFICSGTQILPDDRMFPETWYKKSKDRLLEMINKRNGVILLSGDVHFGEIMKLHAGCNEVGYDLIEMTSSGLTHTLNDNFIFAKSMVDGIFPDTYSTDKDR